MKCHWSPAAPGGLCSPVLLASPVPARTIDAMNAMLCNRAAPIEQSPLELTELPIPEPDANQIRVRDNRATGCEQLRNDPPSSFQVHIGAEQQGQALRSMRGDEQTTSSSAAKPCQPASAPPAELLVAVYNDLRVGAPAVSGGAADRQTPLVIMQRESLATAPGLLDMRNQRFQQRGLSGAVRSEDLSPPVVSA